MWCICIDICKVMNDKFYVQTVINTQILFGEEYIIHIYDVPAIFILYFHIKTHELTNTILCYPVIKEIYLQNDWLAFDINLPCNRLSFHEPKIRSSSIRHQNKWNWCYVWLLLRYAQIRVILQTLQLIFILETKTGA